MIPMRRPSLDHERRQRIGADDKPSFATTASWCNLTSRTGGGGNVEVALAHVASAANQRRRRATRNELQERAEF